MNITFLIGNGFDLNLGLDTRYSDFLEVYKNTDSNGDKKLEYFKNSVLKDDKLWSNAEIAFGKSTEKFKKDGYNAEEFCDCHENFCVELAKYLLEQEQRLNYTKLNDLLCKGLISGLLNYKKGFREEEAEAITSPENSFAGGKSFNFINFNYTQTLDLCVYGVKQKKGSLGTRVHSRTNYENVIGNLLHIHGTVHKDMVLGVNDTSQIADMSLFDGYDDEYISEIIKPRTNAVNQENIETKVDALLNSSDVIYVYGMSIGATDCLWWNKICELMKKKKNLHLIVHAFDAPEDGLIRRAFRMFTKKYKKAITAYCDFEDEEKDDIESRIHVDRTNIFEGLKDLVNNVANQKSEELITA